MATPKRPRKSKHSAPDADYGAEAFAAMVRATLGSSAPQKGRRTRLLVDKKAKWRSTQQAISLGRNQANWLLESRTANLEQHLKSAPKKQESKRAQSQSHDADSPPKTQTEYAYLLQAAGANRGTLVAEGDSWFDYPFHDVLKELQDSFRWDIEHVAHKGDKVESMAYDGGQLDDFLRAIERVVRRGQTPHAILLSGGGNDVAGDEFGVLLNHRLSSAHGLNSEILDGVIDTRIRLAYTTILSAVTAVCERVTGRKVPILLHGYDFPVPDGRGFLGGWGWLPGPWLEPGFREKAYMDLAERVQIAKDLIQRFYLMLEGIATESAFSHVKIVDLRNSLSNDLTNKDYKDWWGNELHPTKKGFRAVANLFDQKL